MNLLSAKPSRTIRPDWQKQLEDWRDMLGECNRKPTRKRVHLLRVATLRMQAQVQYWLDRHASGLAAARSARAWCKQAKQLRRALGTVRAFDVHLASLSKVRAMLTTSSGYQPRSCRATLRQVEVLEGRFRQQRKRAAKDLIEAFSSRRDHLQHTVATMFVNLGSQGPLVPVITSIRLAAMLREAVSAFPSLNADILHDFRKQLKSVRYLGEVAAAGAAARKLAAAVKAAQSAIGEWHDWEELAAEAKRAFRDQTALADLLKVLSRESLQRALTACENLTHQFLPADATDSAPPLPLKKPVRRENEPAQKKQLVSA